MKQKDSGSKLSLNESSASAQRSLGYKELQSKYYEQFMKENSGHLYQPTQNNNTISYEEKFIKKLQEYQSKPSQIDAIIQVFQNVNYYRLATQSMPEIIAEPFLVHFKSNIQKNINTNQLFFQPNHNHLYSRNINTLQNVLDIHAFSEYLTTIYSKKQSFILIEETKVNNPEIKEIRKKQLETVKSLKKIDLILIEILNFKKMKTNHNSLNILKLKLVQFLNYILKDEPEYHGLDLQEKMKSVVSKIQNFKGKFIDGESKINLLRIFFEEYKQFKQESDKSMNKFESKEVKVFEKNAKKQQINYKKQRKAIFPSKTQRKAIAKNILIGSFQSLSNSRKTKQIEEVQWLGKLS